MSRPSFDLTAIRDRLSQGKGPRFWRSLEELAETDEFREFVVREFPRHASEWDEGMDRRRFVKLMAASLAFGGLAGCSRTPEKIVPYVRPPEHFVPGKPLMFATTFPHDGDAIGVLVESHMGRPTKVEGNPDHPASLGATDAFSQAAVLGLYDPDRSQTVNYLGEISTWEAFLQQLRSALDVQHQRRGAGIRLLTETVTSPTLARQIREVLEKYPEAHWHQYEPVGRDNARAGAILAFGEDANSVYRFAEAKVVLSIGADFLTDGAGHVRYARDFMSGRTVTSDHSEMNRLYVVESTLSNTGAAADHRIPLKPSQMESFVRALAGELDVPGIIKESAAADVADYLKVLAKDLRANIGKSVLVAGRSQTPAVHALVHAINATLENVGKTVVYTGPVAAEPTDNLASIKTLVDDLSSNKVEVLVIIGCNPVYTAPVELDFAKVLLDYAKHSFAAHMSLYDDETSELCPWHISQTHPLEAWSDARAYDGTVSILQPLIAPLYDSRSPHELLSALTGEAVEPSYDLVQVTWKAEHPDDFETFWQTSVHDGVIANTAFATKTLTVNLTTEKLGVTPPVTGRGDLELVYQPDSSTWDGRYSNNAWMQELPRAFSKLTWDNAALMAPATAERLGLKNEDVVTLGYADRTIEAPIWVAPGQAIDTVTVQLGYGRRRVGAVGDGVGFNAYALRTAAAPWLALNIKLSKTTRRHQLASTQTHFNMEGRDIVRSIPLADLQHGGEKHEHGHGENGHGEHGLPSLIPDWEYKGYAWGMAIDLTKCVGCSACVVACQAENNIPVVGKEGVSRGREMHWLRIDQYFEGDLDNPEVHNQPMLCQHCERAPCELVCPVAATTHSPEGLNEMTYNRCVGTRYCSNNCPYKVRRFNFFEYNEPKPSVLKLLENPDVTVRSRGVIEKCTYCVQRINAARVDTEKKSVETGTPHRIEDGMVVTACQAACPSQAIVFGDINDPKSRVSQLKANPRNYGVLAELGVGPRTTYLAAVTNRQEEEKHP